MSNGLDFGFQPLNFPQSSDRKPFPPHPQWKYHQRHYQCIIQLTSVAVDVSPKTSTVFVIYRPNTQVNYFKKQVDFFYRHNSDSLNTDHQSGWGPVNCCHGNDTAYNGHWNDSEYHQHLVFRQPGGDYNTLAKDAYSFLAFAPTFIIKIKKKLTKKCFLSVGSLKH